MFNQKKSEETEWTRFSKALSSREREEGEGSAEDEPAPATIPAATPPVSRQPLEPMSGSGRSSQRSQTPDRDEEPESMIGDKTSVDGVFKSESSIRIRGTVQGEIESKKVIFVETKASVTAKVTAEAVNVAGEVNGQIHCTGRVEIGPSGRVTGEINAGALIMQEGAFFEGNLKMGGKNTTPAGAETQPLAAQR